LIQAGVPGLLGLATRELGNRLEKRIGVWVLPLALNQDVRRAEILAKVGPIPRLPDIDHLTLDGDSTV
jgi:hypothetical protein